MRVGIFSPVYHRNKEVEKFLITLLLSNFSDHEVYFFIGINGADSNLRYFISSYSEAVCDKFKKIVVYDPEENIGKPALVNIMVSESKDQAGEDLDYVISLDSDFVMIDSEWLNKLVWIFENKGSLPIGALCSNQIGASCHDLSGGVFVSSVGSFHVIFRNGNEGIAGGLLMTPKLLWDKIGGYFGHRIYASDDGHYALACAQMGLIMGMVPEVNFFHPASEDPGYVSWKKKAMSDSLVEEEKKGFNFSGNLSSM